jgi:hypothetical protein
MTLADNASTNTRNHTNSARWSDVASALVAIFSDSLNAPIVAASVTPYQTRSRNHSGIGANGSITSAKKGG